MSSQPFYEFTDQRGTFKSSEAAKIRNLYAPLCGPDGVNLKSSISSSLSGDIKIDKFRYLTKPVSTEDLRFDLRNFFVYIQGQGIFSLTKETYPDSASVEVGQLWHKLTRRHDSIGLELSALNFIPSTGENIELMLVTVKNTSSKPIVFTPTAAVPLFCRALANKHDHEHVTSLLNRTKQTAEGVVVIPTMKFDEQGHHENHDVYFVYGVTGEGKSPIGTFPTTESFFGHGGNVSAPQAVLTNAKPPELSVEQLAGKEAVGALRFAEVELKSGESQSFLIMMGIASSIDESKKIYAQFNSPQKVQQSLEALKEFWDVKSGAVVVKTGDEVYNNWMRWVTIQPVLRRIFGCSFLPDHDYGKGGKGWRDIWQDLLSLILIEPETVRNHLLNNFAGVRIDGTNATIIGARPGEFIADRNAITRVWMDHGVWPFTTILLYIHQSGDFDILFENVTYFRDPQLSRTYHKDQHWSPAYGNKLKTKSDELYQGSIIEHVLVQHLVQFFNVGEHNCIRLESADWNDGLDMGFGRGESVAFTSFYGGNLFAIADLLEKTAATKKIKTVALAKELLILLDTLGPLECDYNNIQQKKKLLFEEYFGAVQPEISGKKIEISVDDLARDLRRKGEWIFNHLRRHEKVSVKGKEWFNGYYDNSAQRVEGEKNGKVWMTLTGQVFAVMSGLADKKEIEHIVDSARFYLKDRELGGFRLNTDFGVDHYLDLGRAFGFAFGTKENGAFFSHMSVMYAYALYSRGFANEGYEVLAGIYKMATDPKRAHIYPGIPEYFDSLGKGMYHYLTGSASWLVLTVLTQAFGVRGHFGDLLLSPQLTSGQFDDQQKAAVECFFAGRRLKVVYDNSASQEPGKYQIKKIFVNDKPIQFSLLGHEAALINRDVVESLDTNATLDVILQ